MLKRGFIFFVLWLLVIITPQRHQDFVYLDETAADARQSSPASTPLFYLKPAEARINILLDYTTSIYQNTTSSKQFMLHETDASLHSIAALTVPETSEGIPQLEEVKIKAYKQPTTKWQFSVIFDNDIFANRDFYYTNGLKLSLVIPGMVKSPLNRILIGSKNSNLSLCGFTLNQNIYTPTNPDTAAILVGDRPFASYLAIGQFRESYNLTKKLHIRSELNLGVLGPASFGKQVQSSIHEIDPVGWQNQLNNEFVLSYSFEIEKGLVSNSAIEINVIGKTTLGTLYNKLGGGLYLRTGNFMPVYKGPFSFFENKNPGGRYQFWVFTSATVDFVAYDATLQGGLFSQNNIYTIPSGDINRFVLQASMGFALYYNNIGIEYEHFYLSPEFNGARDFSWGRLKGVIAF